MIISVRVVLLVTLLGLTLVDRRDLAAMVVVPARAGCPCRLLPPGRRRPVARPAGRRGRCRLPADARVDPLPEAAAALPDRTGAGRGADGGFATAVTASGLATSSCCWAACSASRDPDLASYLAVREPLDADHAGGRAARRLGRSACSSSGPGAGERGLRVGVPPDLPAADGLPAALRRSRPGHPRAADCSRTCSARCRSTGAASMYGRPAAGSPRSPPSAPTGWTGTSSNPLFDEAWASSAPVRQNRPLSPAGLSGCSAAVPLQIGLRTFGLVAVERGERRSTRPS